MLGRILIGAATLLVGAVTLLATPSTAQTGKAEPTGADLAFIHAAPPLGRVVAPQAALDGGAPGEVSEAAALLKKAGVECKPAEGRMLSRTSKGSLFEMSCKDGLGWDVAQSADGSVAAVDCLAMAGSSQGVSHCLLRSNRNQVKGLQAIADKAKVTCKVVDGVWVGSGGNPPIIRYEATCKGGGGFILDTPQPGAPSDLIATACKDAPGLGLKCTLPQGG